MKAVILAGGEGSRLRPLTENRPKPLVPVGGKLCIEYVINSLARSGFNRIIITTGYMSQRLIETVGDGGKYGASVLYSFEPVPAGTAGAVKKVEPFLDETFVVASGDVLADVDIGELYRFHRERGSVATMALTRVPDPTEFGIVGLDDEGRIIRFKEKPRREEVFSNLINAGIYILEPEVLDHVPEGEMFDFSKNLFPILLERGEPIHGREIKGLWRDIGRPSDLLQASLDVVLRSGENVEMEGVTVEGPVVVEPEARISPGCVIRGPAYIGRGADIQRGTIVEASCIYPGVQIDREARIVRSIILDGGSVGWRSEIYESVLGYGCQVEEDVKVEGSILADGTLVKKHSSISGANISKTG
ncbi:MAG: NDP-sugar synthase [Thermoplasmata archaeon]|nr:NDP-sugar synthase [Thermoplasmata archaeon]